MGVHGHWSIVKEDCTPEEHWFLRSVMGSQRMDDPNYQAVNKAHAFFQGGSDNKKGFAYIECWHTKEQGRSTADEFCAHLNATFEASVKQAVEWGAKVNDKGEFGYF